MAWVFGPPKGNGGGGGGDIQTVNLQGADAQNPTNITVDALHIKVDKTKPSTVAQTLDNKADVGLLPLSEHNMPLFQSDIGANFSSLVLRTQDFNFASFNFATELVFKNGYKIKSTLADGFCLFDDQERVQVTFANANGEMVVNSFDFPVTIDDRFVVVKNDYFMRSDIAEAIAITSDLAAERKVNGQWLLDTTHENMIIRQPRNTIIKQLNDIAPGDILSGSLVKFQYPNYNASIPQNGSIVFQNGWKLTSQGYIGFGLYDSEDALKTLWFTTSGSLRILDTFTFPAGLVDFKVVSNNLSENTIKCTIETLRTDTIDDFFSVKEAIESKSYIYIPYVDKVFSIGNIPIGFTTEGDGTNRIYFDRVNTHISFSKTPTDEYPKITFTNGDYIGCNDGALYFGYIKSGGSGVGDVVFYDVNGHLSEDIKDAGYKFQLPNGFHVTTNDFNDEVNDMVECDVMSFNARIRTRVDCEYNFNHGLKSINGMTPENSGGSAGNLILRARDIAANSAQEQRTKKDGKVTDEDDSDIQTQLDERAEIYRTTIQDWVPMYEFVTLQVLVRLYFDIYTDIKVWDTGKSLSIKVEVGGETKLQTIKYTNEHGFGIYDATNDNLIVQFTTPSGIWRVEDYDFSIAEPGANVTVLQNTYTQQDDIANMTFIKSMPRDYNVDCAHNYLALENKVDAIEVVDTRTLYMYSWMHDDYNFSGKTIIAGAVVGAFTAALVGTTLQFTSGYSIRTYEVEGYDNVGVFLNDNLIYILYDTSTATTLKTYTFPDGLDIRIVTNGYDVGTSEANGIYMVRHYNNVKADINYLLRKIADNTGGGGEGGGIKKVNSIPPDANGNVNIAGDNIITGIPSNNRTIAHELQKKSYTYDSTEEVLKGLYEIKIGDNLAGKTLVFSEDTLYSNPQEMIGIVFENGYQIVNPTGLITDYGIYDTSSSATPIYAFFDEYGQAINKSWMFPEFSDFIVENNFFQNTDLEADVVKVIDEEGIVEYDCQKLRDTRIDYIDYNNYQSSKSVPTIDGLFSAIKNGLRLIEKKKYDKNQIDVTIIHDTTDYLEFNNIVPNAFRRVPLYNGNGVSIFSNFLKLSDSENRGKLLVFYDYFAQSFKLITYSSNASASSWGSDPAFGMYVESGNFLIIGSGRKVDDPRLSNYVYTIDLNTVRQQPNGQMTQFFDDLQLRKASPFAKSGSTFQYHGLEEKDYHNFSTPIIGNSPNGYPVYFIPIMGANSGDTPGSMSACGYLYCAGEQLTPGLDYIPLMTSNSDEISELIHFDEKSNTSYFAFRNNDAQASSYSVLSINPEDIISKIASIPITGLDREHYRYQFCQRLKRRQNGIHDVYIGAGLYLMNVNIEIYPGSEATIIPPAFAVLDIVNKTARIETISGVPDDAYTLIDVIVVEENKNVILQYSTMDDPDHAVLLVDIIYNDLQLHYETKLLHLNSPYTGIDYLFTKGEDVYFLYKREWDPNFTAMFGGMLKVSSKNINQTNNVHANVEVIQYDTPQDNADLHLEHYRRYSSRFCIFENSRIAIYPYIKGYIYLLKGSGIYKIVDIGIGSLQSVINENNFRETENDIFITYRNTTYDATNLINIYTDAECLIVRINKHDPSNYTKYVSTDLGLPNSIPGMYFFEGSIAMVLMRTDYPTTAVNDLFIVDLDNIEGKVRSVRTGYNLGLFFVDLNYMPAWKYDMVNHKVGILGIYDTPVPETETSHFYMLALKFGESIEDFELQYFGETLGRTD